jgi:hypothetical protein
MGKPLGAHQEKIEHHSEREQGFFVLQMYVIHTNVHLLKPNSRKIFSCAIFTFYYLHQNLTNRILSIIAISTIYMLQCTDIIYKFIEIKARCQVVPSTNLD